MFDRVTLSVSLSLPGPATVEAVGGLRDDVHRYLSHLLNVRTLNGMPVRLSGVSIDAKPGAKG